MDKKIEEGMRFWITSRMAEAIAQDDRHRFFLLKQLLDDIKLSKETNEYPWEVIQRGLVDTRGTEVLEAVKMGLATVADL